MKSQPRYQGTRSRPVGSVWEIGLDLSDIYRRCRVYLKAGDSGPPGLHMFIDDRTGEQFTIEDGRRRYYKPGDDKPVATFVHLGRRGGRWVIDEAKLERLVAAATSEPRVRRPSVKGPAKDVESLFD